MAGMRNVELGTRLAMAASNGATTAAEEGGAGERSASEAVRAHLGDQANENSRLNSRLRELLEKLDEQANRDSTVEELMEELEGVSDENVATVQAMLDEVCEAEFEKKLALLEETRALIKKEQDLQEARIAGCRKEYERDFQEITDQLERAHQNAVAANERYQEVLRFIDATCNQNQGTDPKDSGSTTIAQSPSYCELSLSRERPEPRPVISAPRKNSKDLSNSIEKSPKALSVCYVTDCVAERQKGTVNLMPLQISPAESDSSSDSPSSCGSVNATPRFGLKGSKAVTKKSPPVVPRLDLSGTGARAGVGLQAGVETSSALSQPQQNSSQSQCDQFENHGRRTSRRTDSARLISLTSADDPFGGSTDSARMMLSRIKRRAKGGSCGGETGGPINEISVTNGDYDNIVVKKPLENVVETGLDIADGLRGEPSIQEIIEPATVQSVKENCSTEITCKDVAHGTLVHELQRSMSPPDPVVEMAVQCDAADVAENTPTKAEENADGDSVNLQASRQERRIQILLWSAGEKLSTLQTLNNTMFLWEDNPAKCVSLTSTLSDESVDLVLSTLIAAKESQRGLFDSLNKAQGVPRRAICCSAVRELVRAYPPERLVPTSFINDHFVAKFLQQTVIDESCLKLVSATALRNSHDSEAAEFWQALVHHVVAVADHKIATVQESAKDIAEVLLHEMREADIVGDAKQARFELQAFLARCFRVEPASEKHTLPPRDVENDTTEELPPITDTARTYASSAPSQTEEIVLGRQVRDITVTRVRDKSQTLPRVAAKHSRKLSLSMFNSLKFWKQKSEKVPAMDIDYFSMLNLDQITDRSDRFQSGHTAKKYGFSLKL